MLHRVHVLSTAGHVDHGKSTLVRHLTGTDPDRLAEEKRRGLTIDLGFAATTMPSGAEVGFVDVPGHARLIKNMLAGVGAADACLFVVAATEGWKPQSEEHLRILELLGTSHGTIALTKVGLASEDMALLARLEIEDRVAGTFLESAEVVAIDVPGGIGTSGEHGLMSALDRMLAGVVRAHDRHRPRLWIDRAFAIRGSGTVVTGTLATGALRLGDRLAIEPGHQSVRVRGLQSHGAPMDVASPGRRLAVNLSGVGHDEIRRGQALVFPAQWHGCTMLDASLHVFADLDHDVGRRGAYLAYIGSGEHAVRLRILGSDGPIAPGGTGCVRLSLPVPLPLVPGDRYVLRDAGRGQTIGGGEILDVDPVVPAARARPSRDVDRVVAERGWVDAAELERLTGVAVPPVLGRWVVDPPAQTAAAAALSAQVEAAGPFGLDVACFDERQRALVASMPDLVLSGGRATVAGAPSAFDRADLVDHPYLAKLTGAPFAPPPPVDVDPRALRAMERNELVVECENVWFAASAVKAASLVIARLLAQSQDGVTVSDVRAALGTTRKYVLPLLTWADTQGITRRRADRRIGGPRLPALDVEPLPGAQVGAASTGGPT